MTNSSLEWFTSEVKEKMLEYARMAVVDFEQGKSTTEPKRLTEIMNVLTAALSILNEEEGKLEVQESLFFLSNRETSKSIKEVEHKWKVTEDGQWQKKIKTMQDSYSRVISSCKTTLRHLETEAKNQY